MSILPRSLTVYNDTDTDTPRKQLFANDSGRRGMGGGGGRGTEKPRTHLTRTSHTKKRRRRRRKRKKESGGLGRRTSPDSDPGYKAMGLPRNLLPSALRPTVGHSHHRWHKTTLLFDYFILARLSGEQVFVSVQPHRINCIIRTVLTLTRHEVRVPSNYFVRCTQK
jgi:hypothetical protein